MILGECIDQRIGKYCLIRLLGESGSSAVYLGTHLRFLVPVAVKVLHSTLNRSEQKQFLAQAHILSQLAHPHIVQVSDYGIENGTPFLVMNYAPNGTLRQRHPSGGRIPVETVVSYVKQIAGALQYIHDIKLVHRDIKPQNMLLGTRNEVLLSDFGIVVASQSIDANIAGTSDFEGTVLYAAPEQLQGKPGRSSDQYALGVVAYEWLCGDWPFSGSFYEVAHQHMFDPPPTFREKGLDIAPAIEVVIHKALAKEPHKRFDSIWEFAGALEQASFEEPAYSVQSRPRRQFMSPFPFALKAY